MRRQKATGSVESVYFSREQFLLSGTKMFLPHPRVKVSIVGSLRHREVACSASDRQGSSFESCVWGTVSSQSSHHPQEVLLTQFSLYVHKNGLKPDSFHFFLLSGFARLYIMPCHVSNYYGAFIICHHCFNTFKPEFTIVIFIPYKPRTVAILDLQWMKMT